MASSKSFKKVAGPANVSTRKKYNDVDSASVKSDPPRFASTQNRGGTYEGEMPGTRGQGADFAQPLNRNGITAEIGGLGGTHDDIGEVSGFITDGYTDKGGVPFGEAAKFNYLPPGMDISNQMNAEINEMPMRKIIAESYPGDGWMPAPRDLPE